MLRQLSVTTVLDLRTPDEAAERGHYATVIDAMTYSLPMTDVLPEIDELPAWTDPVVVATRYLEMLDSGHEAICEALAILATEAFLAMLHCSAGKDRTGILSAIILGVLGVPTRSSSRTALSGPAMVQLVDHLKRTYPDFDERLVRIAPALIAADPEAMRGFLAGLRAEYGTFDHYLTDLAWPPRALPPRQPRAQRDLDPLWGATHAETRSGNGTT
jgi:hypothetical protein